MLWNFLLGIYHWSLVYRFFPLSVYRHPAGIYFRLTTYNISPVTLPSTLADYKPGMAFFLSLPLEIRFQTYGHPKAPTSVPRHRTIPSAIPPSLFPPPLALPPPSFPPTTRFMRKPSTSFTGRSFCVYPSKPTLRSPTSMDRKGLCPFRKERLVCCRSMSEV